MVPTSRNNLLGSGYSFVSYMGVFSGGDKGCFDAKLEFFCFLDFLPEVGMDFVEKLVRLYFGIWRTRSNGQMKQWRGPTNAQISMPHLLSLE